MTDTGASSPAVERAGAERGHLARLAALDAARHQRAEDRLNTRARWLAVALTVAAALVMVGHPATHTAPLPDPPSVPPALTGIDQYSTLAALDTAFVYLARFPTLVAETGPATGAGLAEAGRQAVALRQFVTRLRDDPLALGAYLRTRPDPSEPSRVPAAADAAVTGVLARVAGDVGAAQVLLTDPDIRRALLLTGIHDGAGAATVLARVTARTQPTAETAQRSAALVRDVFTDLARDPAGWRRAIPHGTPVGDVLVGSVVAHIDAFGSGGDEPVVFTAAAGPGGFRSGIDMGLRDGAVVDFVAAGAGAADGDLARVRRAADAHVQAQLRRAIRTGPSSLDPGVALRRIGGIHRMLALAGFGHAVATRGDAGTRTGEAIAANTTREIDVAHLVVVALAEAGVLGRSENSELVTGADGAVLPLAHFHAAAQTAYAAIDVYAPAVAALLDLARAGPAGGTTRRGGSTASTATSARPTCSACDPATPVGRSSSRSPRLHWPGCAPAAPTRCR